MNLNRSRTTACRERTVMSCSLCGALGLLLSGGLLASIAVGQENSVEVESSVGAERERIGSALGTDVFRDQLQGDPPSQSDVVHLFIEPAVKEFREKLSEAVDLTEKEIEEGVAWRSAELKKRGAEQWDLWNRRNRELQAKLLNEIPGIESRLKDSQITSAEEKELRRQLRFARLEQRIPHSSEVWFMFQERKFEQFLYDNYGGGRIIHQQLGPEALDARRKLLSDLEKAGKFQITDPKLRKLALDYWERPSHPGGFHADRRLLAFPWTKEYQDMLREREQPRAASPE